MQVEIITIGNEVLSGRTLDTNFAFLARRLEGASVPVAWHVTVGDDPARIADALRRALERADAVVITGGLGPTPDDRTRQAVAEALGLELVRDPEVLERIRERVRRLGRALPPSVEDMALVPRGATLWTNHRGTAPGVLVEAGGKPVILLPGVPHEMEHLAREQVVPFLAARSGVVVETLNFRTAGAFESQLHARIGDLPDGWPGAALAYLPGSAGVDLRVTVAGRDAAQVRAVAERARAELRACVGTVVFTEDERALEEVAGEALRARGWRLATAESCTGGLLAKRITDVPGSSRWFERGYVTYSNQAKVDLLGVAPATLAAHGAVSAEVAGEMARGARARAGVEVAVGITGIAGPDGGTPEKPVGTVYVALATAEGVTVWPLALAGPRGLVRERSAQRALDAVRRHAQGLPLEARLPARG